MVTSADALVIGAGAVGASCAFHLARAGLRTVVVDQFGGPAEGSTGRCFASVRGQWADDLNIELSWRSIQAFRSFPDEHGIDVGYAARGYLFAVPHEAWPTHLAAVQRQRAHGVPVEVLDIARATEITPFEPAGIAGATWGPADGVVDPHGLTVAYLELARAHGAEARFRHAVTSLDQVASGWVVRAGPEEFAAGLVVNAAGGWAGQVAALAGLDVPVVHSRRNIYASAPGALDRALPMTIDLASGVYVRTEGDRLLFGGPASPSSAGYSTEVDWAWMEEVLDLGTPRFPWLADLPLDRAASWAGTYEMSPDSQGILGPHPDAPAWFNACGFSGHGFMQAPEIGRLVAEEVVTGHISSVDMTPLRIQRFSHAVQGTAVGMVF
jgi:glycine/D-amino acid oxidase-like deaminating enzyme